MRFTFFDAIILSILTASSIIGMYRGLIKVSISFIAFLFSILGACFLYPFTKDFFGKPLSNELILVILSSTVSYLISLAIFSFLSSKLSDIVKNVSGGIIDRFLGLFAGFIRGGIICVVLFIIIVVISSKSYLQAETVEDITAEDIIVNAINCEHPTWLKKSLTIDLLDTSTRSVIEMLPPNSLQSIKLPKKSEVDNIISLPQRSNLKDHEESFDNEELNGELNSVTP